MFRNIIGFSDENPTKTENLPNFTTNLSKLKTTVSAIEVAAQQQNADTKGVTLYKLKLRNQLISLSADNARKLATYAKLTRNSELLGKVNYSESDLRKSTDESLMNSARIIYNSAEPIIVGLTDYDIRVATQTTFLAAINDFSEALGSPDLAATLRKQATENIVALLETGNCYVTDMAAAVEIVRIKEPLFYLGFKTAQKVTILGKVKLAVKGQTTDANDIPVPRVMMTITLNGTVALAKKTSVKGGFYIRSLATGTYQFAFKKAGYADQTVTVNVNNGEMTKVMVKLVAA